jgi:hypothetical protein
MSKQKYPQNVTTSTGGTVVKKGREHYSHAKADAKKDRKRREAEDRNFKYECLSTADKLKGLGATGSNRQRKRLEALLAKEKAAQVKPAPLTSEQKGAKVVKRAQDAVAALPTH